MFRIVTYLVLLLSFNLSFLFANEIENRHVYNIGDEVSYEIETILPNKSKFITTSKLISANEDEEMWEVTNSPTADKRIRDRKTGNWITSYKDGNEVARAIPYSGGLKFPLKKGDKWTESWTFTAAGGLLTGKSTADFKVKKETIKINGKKYKTLKISMKNPLWNSEEDTSWKKHIRWLDIKSGKTIKEYLKNIGFEMEFTATLIE